MEPSRHTSVVRFGTYEIALHSGELRKAGVRIRVQQQPLRLLEILLEHPGEVVTREELRSRIWPNENFGDFDQAVNVAIAKLRGALGDSADNPRYIETLPRRGYRFIADGMTDELITDLAQISALRVISRTSVMPYKGVRKPLPQIARELNVDAVVEGTVLHSGKQVRITAQLIRAPADKHLWAQSYEGDVSDTLALQKKVARAIVEQIRIKLTPQEDAVLENVKVVNPEAYENYLKGRYFWNKRTADGLKKATYYFNRAIEGDPNYSLPYTGLADIHQLSDHPQLAREEVQKALDLDDKLAAAHNSLARLLYLFNRDWEGADREFKRALELDHNYAPAHHWYSMYLALEGRKEQALAEAQKASELDPLSPVVGANLAKILQEAGQYDKAIEQAKKTLDLEPDYAVTHAVLGVVYQDKRR